MSMTSRWGVSLRRHLAEEDVGKAGRALALALLTVLAATVAGLQGHASLESGRAGRIAEQIALEATGASSSSVIQVGAAYGIYRRWLEQYERSTWAANEAIKAAARPARTSFLFYVVKPGTCGEHAFSRTDAEFQRDVRRYNTERERRGGRSPTNCPQ